MARTRKSFSHDELVFLLTLVEGEIAKRRTLLELEDLPASEIRKRLSGDQTFSDRIREMVNSKTEEPEQQPQQHNLIGPHLFTPGPDGGCLKCSKTKDEGDHVNG